MVVFNHSDYALHISSHTTFYGNFHYFIYQQDDCYLYLHSNSQNLILDPIEPTLDFKRYNRSTTYKNSKGRANDCTAFDCIVNAVYCSLYLRLNQTIPIKQEMKDNINATVNAGSILRATQLNPTTGSKLRRKIALRLSYLAMKSAIGGE